MSSIVASFICFWEGGCCSNQSSVSLQTSLVIINHIQQWKMQEISNPFHRQIPPYFEGIFKLWTHEQQELPFLQMFISFGYQNLAILCLKRPWKFFLEILMLYEVYRKISTEEPETGIFWCCLMAKKGPRRINKICHLTDIFLQRALAR